MLLLAFDTAGPDCAVAVARSGPDGVQVLASASERIGRGHSERLLPLIEAALWESGIRYCQLERIGVTIGPGSFTGVRVGIAAARGLALALSIPAVGVGTLPALALPLMKGHDCGTAVAVLDARRDELYAWAADIRSGAVLMDAKAGRAEDLASALSETPAPLYLTGSGALALAAALAGCEPHGIDDADAPRIADVALLAMQAEVLGPPAPLYLRGADAKPQHDRAIERA